MAAGEIVTFPEDLAAARVETSRAEASEMDIDPARLDQRRRGGIAVHGGAIPQRLRVVGMKYFDVVPDLTGIGVEARLPSVL